MNRPKSSTLNKVFSLLIPAFLGMGYFGSTGLSSSQSEQKDALDQNREDREVQRRKTKIEDIRVENKTRGIILVLLEKDGNFLKLSLKNGSSKVVTAYEIGVGELTIHTECLSGMDFNDVFYPGTIRQERLALEPGIEESGIKILAVIFEDGTDEGDISYIQEIRQYRSGMKLQRERSIAFLRDLLNSDNVGFSTAISAMEDNLYRSNDENKLPFFTRRGLEDERHRFLRLIGKFKGMNSSPEIGPQGESNKQKIERIILNYSKTLQQL